MQKKTHFALKPSREQQNMFSSSLVTISTLKFMASKAAAAVVDPCKPLVRWSFWTLNFTIQLGTVNSSTYPGG